MDKDKIVWIALRCFGLLYAYKAIFAFIRILGNMYAFYVIGISQSNLLIFFFGDGILRDVFLIIIATYFLFYGSLAWRIVSNRVENEFAQSSDIGFSSLLVRMTGVWFLIRAFFELYELLYILFVRWCVSTEILSVPQDLDGEISMANMAILQNLISTIMFLILAYYLFYRGRIIIKFIGRERQPSNDRNRQIEMLTSDINEKNKKIKYKH